MVNGSVIASVRHHLDETAAATAFTIADPWGTKVAFETRDPAAN